MMRSNVLTLRTTRGKDNQLTIESNNSVYKQTQQTAESKEDGKSHIDEPVSLSVSLHDSRVSDDSVLLDLLLLPGAIEGGIAELQAPDSKKKLLFTIKKLPDEIFRRKAQVSVATSLQNIINLSIRSQVIVKLKDKEQAEADLVDILIKDINLTRGDMWEISSLLNNTCVYKNQKLTFLDTIRGSVSSIYRFGKKSFSGYIGINTKIVFRSESARLVFLIQITEEMYHFQEDGEVMFHKVVNSLFPTIFKRWREEGTHHLITIVFAANVDFSGEPWNDLKQGQRPEKTKDYYRVVVDQINVVHWNEIMISLRYEFANFRKDIINDQIKQGWHTSSRFLPTLKSDILNTINLSTTLVVDRFKDPDLRHTTNHFIVISAGNGLHDVQYDDLLDTGKRLLNSELSVDIICLAQPPLHVTPLFRYRDHNNILHHVVPGWIDVSFWNDIASQRQWIPKCKIYELQMMGIMENEMSAVTIENLHKTTDLSILRMMESYDKSVFSNIAIEPVVATQNLHQPKRLSSSASLCWKVSNSAISKAEPMTTATPIFSVSKTAISSLQDIGRPATISSDSTSIIKTEKTTPIPSIRSFPTISLPIRQASTVPSISKVSYQQAKANTLALSSSPNSISASYKEKYTVKDSMKDIMWTEIRDISQKIDIKDLKGFNVGRWQDVFPNNVRRRTIKWNSLSSPSELPITTPLFPSIEDFETNFTFQTHNVSLSPEKERFMNANDLMRDMIHLRLMLGFQICYGPLVEKIEAKRQSEANASMVMKYLPSKGKDITGFRIYLSLDQEVHRISCDFDGTINVQRYQRVNNEDLYRDSFDSIMIRTRYQRRYHYYIPDPAVAKPKTFNWNKLDQHLSGYDDENEDNHTISTNRMKFVLLPAEVPKSTYLTTSGDKQEQLNPEETRVEGLRRLIATLHRSAFNPTEKRRLRYKEEASPEISFYTDDLISLLREQYYDNYGNCDSNSNAIGAVLNKSILLGELSEKLHSDKGIKLLDRKWHWEIYKKSFLGLELVTWLVDNFEDINTREEAVAYGNQLMDRGFVIHVESRHKFLDGHYFYFLGNVPEEESVTSRSNSNNSKVNKFPTTPKSLPLTESDSLKLTTTNCTDSSKENKENTFILSHSLIYDLDSARKSYKYETMRVHYDTVHNPNHCFHIRLEWLTATPKLIDDTINSWSRMCERYGLKLVETPWHELCEIPRLNPFHSYVDIVLAINPWEDPIFCNEKIMANQKFYYHIYLLEYSGFLMDNRASLFFQNSCGDINIRYSWGKPSFKYAQYIHKTGAYIAEIRDTGDLFLAPNNTHISRVNVGNVHVQSNQSKPSYMLDSQKIMLEFKATCTDKNKLEKIFIKAKNSWEKNEDLHDDRISPALDDLTI